MPNLIQVFRSFPKEIFRVNNGLNVELRPWSPQRYLYDVFVQNGLVHAKALNPTSYRAPNGASMRPNSPYQQKLMSRIYKSPDMVVYAVPSGTLLPDDLLLVHERADHYSLQPGRDMTISDLNDKISTFLFTNAKIYDREQWLDAYPIATDLTHLRNRK